MHIESVFVVFLLLIVPYVFFAVASSQDGGDAHIRCKCFRSMKKSESPHDVKVITQLQLSCFHFTACSMDVIPGEVTGA